MVKCKEPDKKLIEMGLRLRNQGLNSLQTPESFKKEVRELIKKNKCQK